MHFVLPPSLPSPPLPLLLFHRICSISVLIIPGFLMDKSDVEMKDATEQLQDPNKELHPQNGSVDVQPLENDEKLPHSAIVEDKQPDRLGTQENLDGVTEPKDVVDAAKNTESELENQNCKEITNGLEMPAENVDKDQQLGEKIGEDQKTKDNIELEKTPIEKGAVPAELTVEKASHNEKGVNDEVKERKEEPADDEVITRENEGMVNEPKQKIEDNSELEKTLIEKGALPAEFTVEKVSHHDTGINEEVKERKDEPADDKVLTSENEGVVNEPKQSENMVDPPSSLEDEDSKKSKFSEAEREGRGADQNSTEAMTNAPKDPVKGDAPVTPAVDTISSLGTSLDDQNPTTPPSMIKYPSIKSGGHSEGSCRNMFNEMKIPGGEDGTPEEQAAFMRELESFYRGRATEFKAPRFYGQQLNCLKLWRSVIKLGGYDLVTGTKLWRQVGESFHPPKTCTTVSWTFRIFYEKALLEYERHVTESGELQLPLFAGSDPSSVDNEGSSFQASGSGRARRDSAARAMQGWHGRLQGNTDLGEQIMKDKNGNNMLKREKSIKSIGSLKQKRPDEVEHPVKAARTEPSKQLVTSVVDVGPPADWVRINVRETKDCYEVYALVPGLLREEVRVQSDPAGRLVITGQPDQPDNPWGITAFKKVVSLPGRIDPLHTSAVVSLHGRLFVRVPFEQ